MLPRHNNQIPKSIKTYIELNTLTFTFIEKIFNHLGVPFPTKSPFLLALRKTAAQNYSFNG